MELPVKEGAFIIDRIDEELEKLDRIKMIHDCRIRCSIEASRRMVQGLPEEVVKAAYVIGPYSLAAMMLGAEEALITSLTKPEKLRELCGFTTKKITEYTEQLIGAGSEVICILEPSAMMLYPEQFGEFSVSFANEITDSCMASGDVGTIYHICGNTMPLMHAMMNLSADAISIDSKETGMDLSKIVEIARESRDGLVIIGNVNPTATMLYGSPEDVKAEVNWILDLMNSYPYFVLSTGCELPPETPMDNIRAFMEAGREYQV